MDTQDLITGSKLPERCLDLTMVKSAVEKIQHDVNNPLCIVTMSLSRLENLIAIQPHPELVKSYEEINISVDRIMEILTRLEDIKRMLEGAS